MIEGMISSGSVSFSPSTSAMGAINDVALAATVAVGATVAESGTVAEAPLKAALAAKKEDLI